MPLLEFRNARFSAGNWRYTADDFNHSRLAIAGYPETNPPASTEFGIPVCALAIDALRRSVRWPATPTCPARTTSSSTRCCRRCRPARQTARDAPITTPCPICTRLSIFVPAQIRVSPTAGRSIVVFAPISTSSSMTTSALLRDLQVRPVGLGDEAEAFAANDRTVLHDDPIAETTRSRIETCEWMTQSSPIRGRRPDDDVRIDDRPRAD